MASGWARVKYVGMQLLVYACRIHPVSCLMLWLLPSNKQGDYPEKAML